MKKFYFGFAAFVFLGLPLFSSAQVSAPQAILSWKARSYAPASYQGKVLPGSNAPLLISLDVFENGKLINVSDKKIYWYMNDLLIDRGVGLQSISVRAPQTLGGGTASIRATIPDYSSDGLGKGVDIPVVSPSVVIEAPTNSDKLFSKTLQLKVTPYFFTVSDLSFLKFSWEVNGKTAETAEDPQNLIININPDAAAGSILDISATVANPTGYFESATAKKSFTLSN